MASEQSQEKKALLSLQELQTAISGYAATLNEEVKEGRTFDDIASLLKEASTAVSAYGNKVEEEKKIGSVAVPDAATGPAKKATDLLSAALTSVAAVTERAAEFDHKHHLSVNLYVSIKSYLEKANAAIAGLRSQAQSTTAAAQSAVTNARSNAEQSLAGVRTTLQELATTVQGYAATIQSEPRVESTIAALDRARSLITAAVTQLNEAPLADKPAVATHELLALARTAINAVTEALPPQVTAVIDKAAMAAAGLPQPTVASTVHLATQAADTAKHAVTNVTDNAKFAALSALNVAKEKATAAVDAATAQLGGIQARALEVASSAADWSIKKAATLDSTYNVSERLATLNESYKVTDKVLATVSSAKALGEQYGVEEKAMAVVNKAKDWDASLTGGKGAAVAESAIALGTTALNAVLGYASEAASKYQAVKEEQSNQASARAEAAVQQAEAQSAAVIAKATETAVATQ